MGVAMSVYMSCALTRCSAPLAVRMRWLQPSNPIGQADTDEQGQRQPCAIVRVKLHLGQQVAQ